MSLPPWTVEGLSPGARSVSASRRTDIPALFAPWMERRLEEGFCEYIPAGPPRRVRRSLAPADVTHFTFWTRWPRPFLPVLDRMLEAGWPTLWNVTVTGLGGSSAEPGVPRTERALAAVRELSARVGKAAVMWRYDPVLLTERLDAAHHRETFARLADALAGHVDRVAVSYVALYGRRVKPDLGRWEGETGERWRDPDEEEKLELLASLQALARAHHLELVPCCQPALRERLGAEKAGCNAWSWATRVHPALARRRPVPDQPCREDCGCSREWDIGCYDTCTLGCRYSYGSCSPEVARRNRARHDPSHPCLLPPQPA